MNVGETDSRKADADTKVGIRVCVRVLLPPCWCPKLDCLLGHPGARWQAWPDCPLGDMVLALQLRITRSTKGATVAQA